MKKRKLLLAFITVAVLVMVFGFTALADNEIFLRFNNTGIELALNTEIDLVHNVVEAGKQIKISPYNCDYQYIIDIDGNNRSPEGEVHIIVILSQVILHSIILVLMWMVVPLQSNLSLRYLLLLHQNQHQHQSQRNQLGSQRQKKRFISVH